MSLKDDKKAGSRVAKMPEAGAEDEKTPQKKRSAKRRRRRPRAPSASKMDDDSARKVERRPRASRRAPVHRESLAELVEEPDVTGNVIDGEGAVRYADEETELAHVEAQIRALEARLDGMIRKAEETTEDKPPPSIREQVSIAAREVVDRLTPTLERPAHEGGMVDSVRELLTSDYYLRQWGRLGMRHRSEEVDDFGLDPVYEQRLRPFADFLYKRYFRVETEGIENIPDEGPCLVVANHSGTLPLDGPMLRTCVRSEHPAERELRWLAEDFVYYLPFVGAFMSRIGGVRACQENAERLLKKKNLVAVFPEGVKGIGKLYRDRYKLQRFGRGGFIRLCLRTRTPLVPCAVIGAEEASPMLYRDELISKTLGLPYLPVTPTFPWLGPMGLVPAPTKWRILFGDRIDFEEYPSESAEDQVLVGRLSERVRTVIQQMIERGLSERQSVWFG